MTTKNIRYQTSLLAAYFSGHRDKWDDFYPSERWIIERVAQEKGLGRVLDVGCARGGLGLALAERRLLSSYTGIDINRPAIEAAISQKTPGKIPFQFECVDILRRKARTETFDTVFSLSCADWNVETNKIIKACWGQVAPKGRMIISLRLTEREGINDIRRSYQPIMADGRTDEKPELANYVVFNINEILGTFAMLRPSNILGYGYWREPSKSAVTPYNRLVFAVFSVSKGDEDSKRPALELHLPLDLWKE